MLNKDAPKWRQHKYNLQKEVEVERRIRLLLPKDKNNKIQLFRNYYISIFRCPTEYLPSSVNLAADTIN